MTRTHSFVALRGLIALLFVVVAPLQQPDAFALANAHASSLHDAVPHRLIKRSASAEGWSLVPRDYMSPEDLAERTDELPSVPEIIGGGLAFNTANPQDASPQATNPQAASAWSGPTKYEQLGTSGVAAMQLSVVTDRYVILFDKAEHNPVNTSDNINAWAALLDTETHTIRALKVKTNSFCAGRSPVFRSQVYTYSLSGNFKVVDGSVMVLWLASAVTHAKVFPPRTV